ncbi:MAG TPA: MraY family glycosyltransferase [Actinomycetota bacterium]|nr:MraY family glycosyltransferase [Actinomycetota bacterium]
MAAYLIVLVVAAGATFALTPLVRRLSIRLGVIDHPSDRKVHPAPTPTMGGLAMWGGFLAAMGVSRFVPAFESMNLTAAEPVAAVVTCTLMTGLGVIDDRRGTSALAKLTAQIFIAGILVLLGVQLAYFVLPGEGIAVLGGDDAVPLTILWVVAAANAVNLVDGLDGLAAGMVAIAAAAFFVYMVRSGATSDTATVAALLSAITVGICLGFLPWNFHPARIFMGDTGAMLLGMLVAIATIAGVGLDPFPPTGGDVAVIALPLLVPLLVLGIPFLDVVLAIVRRMRKGLGIAHADKEHIHHQLMLIGHGHRQAVLLMYLWSALLAGSALAIGWVDGRVAVGAILVCALLLFLVTALPRLLEGRRNGSSNGRAESVPESVGTELGSAARSSVEASPAEPGP